MTCQHFQLPPNKDTTEESMFLTWHPRAALRKFRTVGEMGAAPVTMTRTCPPRDACRQTATVKDLSMMVCVNRFKTQTLYLDFVEDEFVPQAVLPDDAFSDLGVFPLDGKVQEPFLESRRCTALDLQELSGTKMTSATNMKLQLVDGSPLVYSLCHRHGWVVGELLGRWWAVRFSCHQEVVWCHPGRIPPFLLHRTLRSARGEKINKLNGEETLWPVHIDCILWFSALTWTTLSNMWARGRNEMLISWVDGTIDVWGRQRVSNWRFKTHQLFYYTKTNKCRHLKAFHHTCSVRDHVLMSQHRSLGVPWEQTIFCSLNFSKNTFHSDSYMINAVYFAFFPLYQQLLGCIRWIGAVLLK